MSEIVKASDTITFSSDLSARSEQAKRTKWVRFTLAALSGIPWVGSFIGAGVALAAEGEQSEVNDILQAWLESHAQKIRELESGLEKIVDTAEKNSTNAEVRLEDEAYLTLVRQGFRIWDGATSQEARERVRKTLTNAAVSKLATDDLVRLFLSWIETYDEVHFRIIALLHVQNGLTRNDIWRSIDGRRVAENSGDADLYRMMIRDLNLGGVIRQHRDTTSTGEFLKKRRAAGQPSSGTMKSAFDDVEPYELTELGHLFVGYALNEPTTALG